MVSIILCCARVFRSLSRTCSLQLALPVPFHIFSVLLLLVNTTSLLNPTSLAFMTASTMASWPTKGWYMHSSYCNLQRVYSCCIFGLKKNIHSFCISCSLFLLSWWGVAFHCHFLIVSFAAFPGRVIISCFIIEWKNARIQCRVSACLTLLSELELKLQSFCDKRAWAMSMTHACYTQCSGATFRLGGYSPPKFLKFL